MRKELERVLYYAAACHPVVVPAANPDQENWVHDTVGLPNVARVRGPEILGSFEPRTDAELELWSELYDVLQNGARVTGMEQLKRIKTLELAVYGEHALRDMAVEHYKKTNWAYLMEDVLR